MLTNFERWRIYTQDLCSPQNYIDWTWRFIVSAALQRRVWLGIGSLKCFATSYNVLVGNPGIGKGVVLRKADQLLSHWKVQDSLIIPPDRKKALSPQQLQEPLIKTAPNASTYEALCSLLAKATSFVCYKEINGSGFAEEKIYSHASLCFCLQELGSLFRKHTNDLITFLREMYDCNEKDFTYITIGRGEDRIRRGCLSFIAGADPDFMQELFNDKLIEGGFLSRTFFIYSKRNRKSVFTPPDPTQEQIECEHTLLEHVRKLTTLYGRVAIDKETLDYLQNWWSDYNDNVLPNKPSKLNYFGARMNLHVMKVALANHFGESLEMTIPLWEFKRAIEILSEEENNMCQALMIEQHTQVSKCVKRVLECLLKGPKNFVDLYCDTVGIASKEELTEALQFLQDKGSISALGVESKTTGKVTMQYQLKGQQNDSSRTGS